MADSQFKTGSFAKTTSAGPVDQAITGVGFTPKALILFCSNTTANDTLGDGMNFAMGVSDGTDERSIWFASQDAFATADCDRYANTTKALCLRGSGSSALLAEADVKTFDSDGFTLTWTTNNAVANIIKYVAIGGDDLSVDVFEFTQKTSTGSQSVATGLNTADFVMLFGIGNTAKDSTVVHANCSIGMATGPSNEGAMSSFSRNAVGTSQDARYQRTSRVYVHTTDSAVTSEAEFTNFTTTGFDLNYISSDGSARAIFGLTIKGGQWEVGSGLTKASTGTQAYTTSFNPTGLIQFGVGNTASTSKADHFGLMLGSSSGNSGDVGASVTDENGVGTTDSYKKSSSTYLMDILSTADGSVLDRASVDSFNSTDFTLNFETADATQREFIWAVLKEAGGSKASTLAMTGVGI